MQKATLAVALALALPACSQPGGELEQRIAQLEDEKEIRELLVAYGEFLDAKDYAGYASLFSEDGTWTGGFGSATGPEAIQAMLEEFLGKPEPGYVNKERFHLMTTMVVHVDGDTATARSRFFVFDASPEGQPVPGHAGRYVDQLVRQDSAWKFKSRATHGVIPYREGTAPAQ